MSDLKNLDIRMPENETLSGSTETTNVNPPEEPKKHGGGPRTPEGKKRSSQNARRHSITSRVHIATPEESGVYDAHLKSYLEAFAPVGIVERDLVADLASLRFRLARIAATEDAIFALGLEKFGDSVSDHPQLGPALAQGLTWIQEAKNIQLLSLYESRLRNAAARAQAEIERLQTARKQAYAKAQEHAIRLAKVAQSEGATYDGLNDFQPAADFGQFVFSATQVAQAADRQDRLLRSCSLGDIALKAA